MRTFAIDFIRQCIIQTILMNYIESGEKLIGNENQISLVSFYEHIASGEEVDRFVNAVKELNNQQNRTGLIANGVIVAPSNPTITNINQKEIIPLEFNCGFRTTLKDRDLLLETLDYMIKALKGRKRDIALLDNGKVFMVGTIANNSVGVPLLCRGDYIGECNANDSINTFVSNRMTYYQSVMGLTKKTYSNYVGEEYYYLGKVGTNGTKLVVVTYNSTNSQWVETIDDGTHPTIIFPPTHDNFIKYKASMSFESFRCSEPRTLNAEDYVDVSYGGSATVCDSSIKLGNDLSKLRVSIQKLETQSGGLTFSNPTKFYLEPLELPSGLSTNNISNQLSSNNFKVNSHTDAITPKLQYTFVMDEDIEILNKWFDYARYGTFTTPTDTSATSNICPNMIYKVGEWWVSWGLITYKEYSGKIIGDIDIENTESDVLTLSISMQVQGANN